MVIETLEHISNLRGDRGEKGDRGLTGTFANVSAVSIPAGEPARAEIWGPEDAKNLRVYVPRGQSGVNAIPAMDAVAEYVLSTDSPVYGAIDQLFVAKDTIQVNPLDHGIVGDGRTADSDAMQQLLLDVPDGSQIVAPSGRTFLSAGWTVPAGKSVSLQLPGSRLIQASAAPILDAVGEWSAPVQVQSASRTTVNLSSTAGFAVGDLVKVYSDNLIWDARPRDPGDGSAPTEFARQGEFAVVTEVAPTVLTIHPPLFDTYDINIRIAKKLEQDVQLTFGLADFQAGGFGTMFRFDSLRNPYLRGRVLRGNGAASGFRSCYGYGADLRVSDLPQGTGYGVANSGSVMGRVNIHATRVRHAYTDDTAARIASGTTNSPGSYGRAMYDDITGSSFATLEAAWDTHHGGIGHRFHDITASGVMQSMGPGFSVRGRFHRFDSCLAFGGSLGFRLHDESTTALQESWAVTENIELNNCSTRDTYAGIEIALSNYMPASRGVNLTVTGGVFEARAGQLLYASRARIAFNDPTFRHTLQAAPVSGNLFKFGLVDLRGRVRLDGMAIQSGSLSEIMSFANAGTSWQSLNLDVDLDLSEYIRGALTTLYRLTTSRGQIRTLLNGTTTASITAGATTTPDQMSLTLRAVGSNTAAASSAMQSASLTANGQTLSPGRSADPVVTIRTFTNAARSIAGVSVGAVAGQQLIIMNAPSSTGTITIPVGATNMNVATAIVIPVGQSARFVWDGTSNVWVQA